MTAGRVSGKVAIITGAAQGMGESHARVLLREGAKVILADISDELGEALSDDLGENAAYARLDVTDPNAWARVVKDALERFGTIDVLVNNAGISTFASIREASLDDFQRTIDINLVGTFNGIKAVEPTMVEAGQGSIINISSISGMKGSNHLHAYTASKWAVRGLTKSVAVDLGRTGVRVNSVHPGQILTPAVVKHGIEYPTEHVAMGRPGQPEEISELVLYLASDASRFSTGSEFVADGGEMAGLPQTLI